MMFFLKKSVCLGVVCCAKKDNEFIDTQRHHVFVTKSKIRDIGFGPVSGKRIEKLLGIARKAVMKLSMAGKVLSTLRRDWKMDEDSFRPSV